MLTLKVIGAPDIIPLLQKSNYWTRNVIAPIATLSDISIKLASLIFPITPKLNASGLRNAEIATKTVANPTIWKTAKSSKERHWNFKSYYSANCSSD